MYERVNGKRFVAGLLDAIIVGVIAGIPILIYTFTTGIDDLVNSFTGSFATPETGAQAPPQLHLADQGQEDKDESALSPPDRLRRRCGPKGSEPT